MKKLHYLAMICLAAFFLGAVVCCTEKENNGSTGNGNGGTNGGFTDEYVDLGLPSGTKWKLANEVNAADTMYDFYTYDEAVAAFEDALPTKGQVQELKDGCQWSWTGNGYRVTGPNGNSIVLPAAGSRGCDGDIYDVGSYGYYWTATPYGDDDAWDFGFDSSSVSIYYYDRCDGRSIRLVQD